MYHKIYKSIEKRWDTIAKPIDGLGKFEKIVCKIGAIKGSINFSLDKKILVVFCSDNGVVEEGVTQVGSHITSLVCGNIAKGIATSSKMAKSLGVDCISVDVGISGDTKASIDKKIDIGTKNLAKEKAMSITNVKRAIEVGIEMVAYVKNQGYDIMAVGEMGIGNTTTAACCASVILDKDASLVAGRGSGLTDDKLAKKIDVINKAIAFHKPNKNDAYDIISKVGGFDIAAMTGAYIGGKIYGVPIVVDGAISQVALLLARLIEEDITKYAIASHIGKENLSKLAIEELKIDTVIDADLALGEGTGAIMLFPLLDSVIAVYNNKTFADLNIESYKR